MKLRLSLVALAVLSLAACASPSPAPQPEPAPPSVVMTTPIAEPASVSIPALAITDEIVPVGIEPSGGMEVPPVDRVGWYNQSPYPGSPPAEIGPAILAGHVNWRGVAGTFAHIGRLKVDDTVEVTDTAGNAYIFVVYAVAQFKKVEFEANVPLIFNPTPGPELRLVTCSGDVIDHEYTDNTVVSARLR